MPCCVAINGPLQKCKKRINGSGSAQEVTYYLTLNKMESWIDQSELGRLEPMRERVTMSINWSDEVHYL